MHLTYPDSDTHTGTASPANAGEAGAPGTEIEITPEMVEAGYDALFDDPMFPEGGKGSTCNAIKLAFRLMLRVHHARSSGRL
jgi:hypothetical protein